MLLHVILCACTAELAGKHYEIYIKDKHSKHLLLTNIGEDVLGWVSEGNIEKNENHIFLLNEWQYDKEGEEGIEGEEGEEGQEGEGGEEGEGTTNPQFWGVDSDGLFCCDDIDAKNIKPFVPDLSSENIDGESQVLHFPNLTKLMDFSVLPGLETCNDVYYPLKDEKDDEEKTSNPEKLKEPGVHKLSNLVKSHLFGGLGKKSDKKKPDKEDKQSKDKDKKAAEDKDSKDKKGTKDEDDTDKQKDADKDITYQIELSDKFVGENKDRNGVILYETNDTDETKWEIIKSKSGSYQIKRDGLCLGMEQKVKQEKKIPAKIKNCESIVHEIFLTERKDGSEKHEDKKKDDEKKNVKKVTQKA